MKAFHFSLNTLLKVRGQEFTKDAHLLATLQQNLLHLEKQREEMQTTLEETLEALIAMPKLSSQLEAIQERIFLLEIDIKSEKLKIFECQEKVQMSLNKRKIVEKIRETRYAHYQKELSRHNDAD